MIYDADKYKIKREKCCNMSGHTFCDKKLKIASRSWGRLENDAGARNQIAVYVFLAVYGKTQYGNINETISIGKIAYNVCWDWHLSLCVVCTS